MAEAIPNLSISTTEGNGHTVTVPLPSTASRLLVQILSGLAEGCAVAVVSLDREMTTQEAADFLEMSRPSLIKLLDHREISHRKVGRHRRVRLKDLVEYKERSMIERRAALDELAQQAQELGMGYE